MVITTATLNRATSLAYYLVLASQFGRILVLPCWQHCLGAAGAINLQSLIPQTAIVVTASFRRLYVPATQFGGGERLIWEARVAGVRSICSCLELRSTHCVLQIPSERIEIESDNDGLREFISGTLSDIPLPTPPSLLSYPTFFDSSTFMQTAACSSRSQHLLCNQHLNVRFF